MVIAIPGIFKMRDRMNEKALNAKIESIESAAIMHVQNNSNKYKSYFGECTTMVLTVSVQTTNVNINS